MRMLYILYMQYMLYMLHLGGGRNIGSFGPVSSVCDVPKREDLVGVGGSAYAVCAEYEERAVYTLYIPYLGGHNFGSLGAVPSAYDPPKREDLAGVGGSIYTLYVVYVAYAVYATYVVYVVYAVYAASGGTMLDPSEPVLMRTTP